MIRLSHSAVSRSGLAAALTVLAWGLTAGPATSQQPAAGPDRVALVTWTRANESGNMPQLRQKGQPPGGGGWSEGSTSFEALKAAGAGTVAVYEWTASYDRYAYLPEAPTSSGPWTKGGIAFYAYTSQVPGTVPIYNHSAPIPLAGPSGVKWYQSPHIAGGTGWKKENTAYFAYPAPQTAVILQQWLTSNSSGNMHRLLPKGTSPGDPWKQDGGDQFIALTQPHPGTVPVGVWTASSNRYAYGNAGQPPLGMASEGIAFYAFDTQIPGTVPVYKHEAPCDGGLKHMLSTSKADPKSGWAYGGIAFYAFPADPEVLKWQMTSTKLVFDPLTPDQNAKLGSVTLFDQEVAQNKGKSEVSQKIGYKKSRDEKFKYSFHEELKIGYKQTTEAEIPLIGKESVELSAELKFGADQEWETSVTVEYAYESEVKVAPGETVRLKGTVSWAEFPERKFTMVSTVEASVHGKKISYQYLKPVFHALNPTVTKLDHVPHNDHALQIKLRGTVSGSCGLTAKTQIIVTDAKGTKTEKEQSIPKKSKTKGAPSPKEPAASKTEKK